MQSAKTLGIHHLGLTVPALGSARAFFIEVLGFHQVREVPEYPAVFLTDGTVLLTLWQAEPRARDADRKHQLGMHHVAFRVANQETLEDLSEQLRQRDDVRVEFQPEPLGGGPSRHMMFYIPGNIRIELIAPAKP